MTKQGARKGRPPETEAPKPEAEVTKTDTDGTQKGTVMQDAKKVQEMFTQGSGKAIEALTVWADANQRVLREMAELSAATAKEGVRLYAELQQASIEVMRDAQAATLRWQSIWQASTTTTRTCRSRAFRPARHRSRMRRLPGSMALKASCATTSTAIWT